MSLSDIYFMANQQLRLSDLKPLDELLYDALHKGQWEEGADLNFSEWKERISEAGYDPDKIYFNNNQNSMSHFFYVDEYCATTIHALEPAFLEGEFALPMLKMNQIFQEKFNEGDFTMMFFPEWNTFAIDYFIRLYEQIPKERRWEVFEMIYTYANYGFSLFPEHVLSDVFLHANTAESVELLTKEGHVNRDGFLTVYRGEGLRSTPVENSHSWTLSRDVAFRFANHFGQGRVYKAHILVEKVISYQFERDEAEVLVNYKDLVHLSIEQDYHEEGNE